MNVTYNIIKKELKKGKSVIEIAKKYKVTRQAVYWHIERKKNITNQRKIIIILLTGGYITKD